MSVSAPHFMLFAQVTGNTLVGAASRGQANADSETAAAEYGGRWRFILQSAEGKTFLDAEDEEEGNSRERLELLAIVRGLEALDQPSQVTLHTQSQAISRGIREGLAQWRENDYQWERFGSLTPIKNSDLWRRVDGALQIHQVTVKLTTIGGSDDLNLPDAVDFTPTASAVTMPKARRVRGKQLRFDAGEASSPEVPGTTATAKASPRRTRVRQPAAATSLWQRAVGGVRSLFSNGDR